MTVEKDARIAELEAEAKQLRTRRTYSPETIAAYGATLESAFPDDPYGFVGALKELAKL